MDDTTIAIWAITPIAVIGLVGAIACLYLHDAYLVSDRYWVEVARKKGEFVILAHKNKKNKFMIIYDLCYFVDGGRKARFFSVTSPGLLHDKQDIITAGLVAIGNPKSWTERIA